MNLRTVKFPLAMTLISFILFIMIYVSVTANSVIPYYLRGLIFAIPFICFGVITLLRLNGKLKGTITTIITAVLVAMFPIIMFFQLVSLTVDYTSQDFTSISQYQRVLKVLNHKRNERVQHFPNEIPQVATNAELNYKPRFLQGGELLYLKYDADTEHINQLEIKYKEIAQWTGPTAFLEQGQYLGINNTSFDLIGFNTLPEYFTIYVIDSKPYKHSVPDKPENWNHGYTYGLAISKETNTVIYFYENW